MHAEDYNSRIGKQGKGPMQFVLFVGYFVGLMSKIPPNERLFCILAFAARIAQWLE